MKSAVASLLVGLVMVACVATPELQFADDGDGGSSSSASSASSGWSPGGSSSGGSSFDADVVDAAVDPGPPQDGGIIRIADAGGGLTCPLVKASGVQCCAAAQPASSRTCVRVACSRCDECLAAGCKPTQFCCVKGGGGDGKPVKAVTCANGPSC